MSDEYIYFDVTALRDDLRRLVLVHLALGNHPERITAMTLEEFARLAGDCYAPERKRFGDRLFEKQPDGSWKPVDDETENGF